MDAGCTLLPLIKRPAPKQDERAKRDRNLALPGYLGGKPPKPSDFEVGCEVLVPRVHNNGRTFHTWCVVLEVRHTQGMLLVDVPKEEPQPVSMVQLHRVAEVMNDGPAGYLLAEVSRLRAEVARLDSEVVKLRKAAGGAPASDASSPSTALVPWKPRTPTTPLSL